MSLIFYQKCSYLLLQSKKGFHNLSGVVPIEQPLNISVHSGSRLISDGGAKHGYAEEEDGPSHNMETSYNSGISPPVMSKQKGMYTDVASQHQECNTLSQRTPESSTRRLTSELLMSADDHMIVT